MPTSPRPGPRWAEEGACFLQGMASPLPAPRARPVAAAGGVRGPEEGSRGFEEVSSVKTDCALRPPPPRRPGRLFEGSPLPVSQLRGQRCGRRQPASSLQVEALQAHRQPSLGLAFDKPMQSRLLAKHFLRLVPPGFSEAGGVADGGYSCPQLAREAGKEGFVPSPQQRRRFGGARRLRQGLPARHRVPPRDWLSPGTAFFPS